VRSVLLIFPESFGFLLARSSLFSFSLFGSNPNVPVGIRARNRTDEGPYLKRRFEMELNRWFSAAAGFALVASFGVSAPVRAEEVSVEAESVEVSNYDSYCVVNVCEGDVVEIYNGGYSGYRGRVVDTNNYNYTVTVLLDIGGYLTVDVRAVYVLNRMPPPARRYPRPSACPYGYIYDMYRGCVPMVRPRPVPRPYPAPYPAPGRGRVEQPRYPQPPRGGHRGPSRGGNRGGHPGGGQHRGPGHRY
jgi:hypothetical protein